MANKINREARGFLDLLRAKVGGQGPREFDNNVKTTIDVTSFLAGPLLQTEVKGGLGGTGTYTTTVPQDETWLLYRINGVGYGTNQAADLSWSWRIKLAKIPRGVTTTDCIVKAADFNTIGNGAVTQDVYASIGFQPPVQMFLPPGVEIQLGIIDSGANLSWALYTLFTRLKV